MLRGLLLFVLLVVASWPVRAEKAVTVFAASSLSEAMTQIAAAFEEETGAPVVLSLAGTATLARQIEAGAPADVFVSADTLWMDYAAARGAVRPATIVPVASNSLVVIGPAASSPLSLAGDAQAGRDLIARLDGGRFAIADPDTVPAGRYGKTALEALGLWGEVSGRLAPMENVRVALASVARGDTPLGLVYATDAAIEPGVAIVARVPKETHPEIVYPAAVTAEADLDGASAFLTFLKGATAAKILHSFAFVVDISG